MHCKGRARKDAGRSVNMLLLLVQQGDECWWSKWEYKEVEIHARDARMWTASVD